MDASPYFYNGLRNATRIMIDASTGGALMKKTTDQAYEILEDAATSTNKWPRDKITLVKAIGGDSCHNRCYESTKFITYLLFLWLLVVLITQE